MASPIRLPPSTVSTGTTGTNAVFKPNKPEVIVPQAAEPADGFSSEAPPASSQLTGRDVLRAPGQLTSDLKRVKDPNALPGLLKGDLKVHLPELVGLLSLTREQKASRLVEFLAPYAGKLAELASALPADQRSKLAAQLLEPMRAAGLSQVVETTTGKSGVAVAHELLGAASAEEVREALEGLRFDAPQWTGVGSASGRPMEPALVAQQVPQGVRDQRLGAAAMGEEEKGKSKERTGTDKKLGRNMVFNVLHLFRDDRATQREKEKLEAGIVTIALISLAIAVCVAIGLAVSR